MIPWLLKIHISGQNKKCRKIWIPLPLIYIPVLILIIVLSPLLIIGAIGLLIIKGTNMFKAIPVFFIILTASSGFLIDIRSKKERFSVTIK
jgi:RsiW-degrading membrane proteinase PrsW (M82 family)